MKIRMGSSVLCLFLFLVGTSLEVAAEPRRLCEQRWLIDNTIATVGVDWSWPISSCLMGSTCPEIHPDLMMAIHRIKKLADISREFSRVGERSMALAKKAEAQGHLVSAREYYFSAANLFAAAQWPIWEDDHKGNLELSKKKNSCYEKYIEYAAHRIEKVEIPFEGKFLPGYLHLPNKKGDRFPCTLVFDGMDAWKEMQCAMYGDKLLERGIAVLLLDGPGQAEASIRKIKCTHDNFPRAGKSAIDFIVKDHRIDSEKIAIWGASMGSFWIPQVAAYDKRIKAVAVALVCHEPGMKTIFNEACPSFKARYMWMSGYTDEDKFDIFAQKLSLKGVGKKIDCPMIIVAGEDDQLSPIKYTYDFYNEVRGPKNLYVYEGQKHEVYGPLFITRLANWIKDRLDGKPMESGVVYVDFTGREIKR